MPIATIREHRSNKLVEPGLFRLLIAHAPLQLRAVLYLAANAGFGATDCAQLRWDCIDLEAAIIRGYRRPKTRINRDAPLWPETVAALLAVQAERPRDTLVFRTAHGNAWNVTSLAHEIADLVAAVNAKRAASGLSPVGLTLGDLRHTFSTYANETLDQDAWKRIMGHALPGLKQTYVEGVLLPRLRSLVVHVRTRILPEASAPDAAVFGSDAASVRASAGPL